MILRQTILCIICSVFIVAQTAGAVQTGVYGTWGNVKDTMFQAAKANNFKLVVSSDVGKAAALNMQCLYPFWLTKEIAQDEARWKLFIENVKTVVTTNKDNPAVFGWYLTDEPEWHQVPLDKIKQLSRVVKSIDKVKPTFVVLASPDVWGKYMQHFDIIAIDPYIDTTSEYSGKETTKVDVWIKKARRDLAKLKMNKPLYVVLGAFDRKPKTTAAPFFRKPSPSEFRTMVSICLQHKVDGILVFSLSIMEDNYFWAWNLINDDPALWDTVRALPVMVAPGAH